MKHAFTKLLLYWNSSFNERKMPWKGEKDPYKIWLSEIMLQQTRVEQGLGYYERFVKKYPTIAHLAKAADEEVFKMWEGLGYYSRCRNLLHTAREIYLKMNGRFPDSHSDILALKGVGPYTAAAIASFAYKLPYAVVDGNVQRVLARYFGITEPVDSTTGKQKIDKLAQQLLDKKEPAVYNQAIMDFGATVCKPKLAECTTCSLNQSCYATQHNMVDQLPAKTKKIIRKHRWFYYIVLHYKGYLYIKQRKGKDVWQGLHEFILMEKSAQLDPTVIKSEIKDLYGKNISSLSMSKMFVQQLTHQTITGCFVEVHLSAKPLPGNDYYKVSVKALSNYAFPKLILSFMKEKKYI